MTTTGGIRRKKEDLASGMHIGRYRIEHPVGRGGMGTVYSAFDETTNRVVALKLLAEGIPESLRDRFLAECEAEANIRHEHVMPVYDRGWLNDDRPYFVMELLYQPVTLTDIMDEIDQGRLGQVYPRIRQWSDTRRLIADVLVPICEGVHVANVEYGVQHRDLKPDNVLIDIRTRRPYLIDFGICRAMDDETDAGKIVGTPRFLSPEQARGQVSDKTDVWGLGALLRYVVSGEPPLAGTSPFSRKDVHERIAALKKAEEAAVAGGDDAKARGYAGRRAQLEDPTLRVQEDLLEDAVGGVYLPLPEGVSAGLGAIIKKAMATRPEDRYENAGALVKDLRTWLRGGSVQALSEEGARGAAADYMKRLVNRNTVRSVGVLITLAVGFLIGSGLFSEPPPPADHHLEDAASSLEALRASAAAVQKDAEAGRLTPLGTSTLLDLLQIESEETARRLATEPAGAEKERLEETQRALQETLAGAASLSLPGWGQTRWTVTDMRGRVSELRGDPLSLPTGIHELRANPPGALLRVAIPLGATARRIGLGARSIEIPSGMTWIPAGPAHPEQSEVMPAFLASRDLVTNEKYSEWLDDLSDVERLARVPPTGFRRSETNTQRWLVEPDTAGDPVRGIRPDDARAYAAWRAAAEGIAYRLPTTDEWQRMAAIDALQGPTSEPLFRWHAHAGSPYGVKHLFDGAGEIVSAGQEGGFVLKGRGGILPMPSAVLRGEPIDERANGHDYGFRLVYRP